MRIRAISLAMVALFLIAGALSSASLSTASEPPRTIGYWKNHQDVANELFPLIDPIVFGKKNGNDMTITASQAMLLLNYQCPNTQYKVAMNGYVKLGGQIVAAELNIANGVDGSAVTSLIQEGKNVLSSLPGPYYNAIDWFFLEKATQQYVLDLVEQLDDFNNGM